MKNYHKLIVLLAIIIVSTVLINAVQQDPEIKKENSQEQVEKNTSETYVVKALKIPEDLSFAGERVPLEKPDVKERIDRELLVNTYWQSNGLLWLKRINKYFPIIEPILKEEGVPNDFKYLAVIESDLLNVTSPAGAKGMWQMLKTAARENGLEVNENVDERYNLEKATRAACKYLKGAKKRLGSWSLAAGAYHAGNHGIDKRMKQQLVTNYWDVLAGEMTERYVPRILAAKEILSNPEKYGFEFDEEDLYTIPANKTLKINKPITNIAAFAKKHGTYYKELKSLNPWLRENKLNNKSGKTYFIKIPKK